MCARVRTVGLAVALAAAACAHAPEPPPSAPSPAIGRTLPDLRRPTVQGPTFDMASAKGRVLVVEFFAAYCRPCQRALPAVEALHAAHPDVAFLGVSLDDAPEEAMAMVARHRLTFPVVHDAGHVLAGHFRVTDLPSSFVVDAAGRIIWATGIDSPDDALERAVTAIARAPQPTNRQ
jgi:peroxiredoxin